MTQDVPPRTMTLDEFTPYLATVFTAQCVPKDIDLTLVEAYPMKNHARLDRPPFMLIFHSDPMTLLTDGLYVLRSGAWGPAAVGLQNIVPAPGAAPGHYYQAVFN